MENNEIPDIVIDPASGIPEEEQRAILSEINGIAEKNQGFLAKGGAGEKGPLGAKKRGGVFPAVVNAAALAVLAGGFFLLSFFHGREEISIRERGPAYNSTEWALIREIRKETASLLEAKETEIALIVSKLADVDGQLQVLHSSNRELSAEQLNAEANLEALQNEYRTNLASLQDERSLILESSRLREAGLKAQLEARTRELKALSEQSQASQSAARAEIDRLTGEQQKIQAIEGQMAGYFAAAQGYIRDGRLTEASGSLGAAGEFLNTPAFAGLRSFNARKDIYAAAITALESMLDAARNGAFSGAGETEISSEAAAGLQARNAQLEEDIASLRRTLEAGDSLGSELNRRIAEYEERIAALRNSSADQERLLADRDDTIAGLQERNTELAETAARQDTAITELRAQNAAHAENIEKLNRDLANIRAALQALSVEN